MICKTTREKTFKEALTMMTMGGRESLPVRTAGTAKRIIAGGIFANYIRIGQIRETEHVTSSKRSKAGSGGKGLLRMEGKPFFVTDKEARK